MLWLMIILAFVFLGVGLWLWWWFPRWRMEPFKAEPPKAQADIEDNFRKTVGQVLTGLFVLIGAGIAYWGTLQTLGGIADLIRADVRHALIEPRQLDAACGPAVKLDPGLTIKPC